MRPPSPTFCTLRPPAAAAKRRAATAAAGGGRHEQARALLSRLLAQKAVAPRALGHALVAIALVDDTAALRACWRHIDALDEAPLELCVAVVEALRFHDHLDEAHRQACRLTEALPQQAAAWRLRAEVCAAAGRLAEAAMAWREVAGLLPDDPAAHMAHGWALLALPPGASAAREAFARALDLGAAGSEALDGQQLAIAAEGSEARSAAWLHRLALRHPRNAELAESFIHAALREQVLLGEAYAALPALLTAAGDEALVRLVRRLTRAAPAAVAALLGWLRGELTPPQDQVGRACSALLSLGAPLLLRLAKEAARQQARAQGRPRAVPLPGLDAASDAPAVPRLSLVWGGHTYEGPSPGCNHQVRAVIVTETGGLAWLPWGAHTAPEVGSAGDRLRVGGAWQLSLDQDARLAALLCVARVGSLTAGDFIDQFGRRGEGFLVGGSVRDLLAPADLQRAAGEADIDLASSLSPALAALVGGQLTAGLPGLPGRPGGVVSPYSSEYFGLVRFGVLPARAPVGGIDVMSLRT